VERAVKSDVRQYFAPILSPQRLVQCRFSKKVHVSFPVKELLQSPGVVMVGMGEKDTIYPENLMLG
jgi:hypothetical protein